MKHSEIRKIIISVSVSESCERTKNLEKIIELTRLTQIQRESERKGVVLKKQPLAFERMESSTKQNTTLQQKNEETSFNLAARERRGFLFI